MSAMGKPSMQPLSGGGAWLSGEMDLPVVGVSESGPIVMGAEWLLEIVRFHKERRTFGLFYAPFGIVNLDLPEFAGPGKCSFVGWSAPRNPPAEWLQTSLAVDLGKTSLPSSPEELLRLFARPLSYRSLEVAPDPSGLSRAAKRRICDTYRDDIPISEIAAELKVSHSHLSRQFKRDFGFSLLNYRHRLRVTDATSRLYRGDKILDVGEDVGFNDTSRFYQGFRKITGVPPGKCRL
jgi:AraC-like DNA-binding protein